MRPKHKKIGFLELFAPSFAFITFHLRGAWLTLDPDPEILTNIFTSWQAFPGRDPCARAPAASGAAAPGERPCPGQPLPRPSPSPAAPAPEGAGRRLLPGRNPTASQSLNSNPKRSSSSPLSNWLLRLALPGPVWPPALHLPLSLSPLLPGPQCLPRRGSRRQERVLGRRNPSQRLRPHAMAGLLFMAARLANPPAGDGIGAFSRAKAGSLGVWEREWRAVELWKSSICYV